MDGIKGEWIGDFRVAFRLCFKASPSAKPFTWKLVFTCKWTKIYVWINLISIWKASHRTRFETEVKCNSEITYSDVSFRSGLWKRVVMQLGAEVLHKKCPQMHSRGTMYRCMHWLLGHTVQDLTITVHQFHYNCTSVINWATRKPSTTASLASVSLLGIPMWALSQNSLFHSWSLWYTEPISNRTTCKVNSTRYYREINLVQGTTTGWLL